MTVGVVFLACTVLSVGCGNPEAPKIENVRLSYWDSLAGDGSWVTTGDEGDTPQSPVRIEGTITDNTAVVNPRIAWIAERGDVDEEGFTECSDGVKEFYECEMECEGPTNGYFECAPAFDAEKLIRGDIFLLTGTKADGETFELEVSVSEAQELTDNNQAVEIEYRIFRVSSLEGDPGFIWSVYHRTTCDTSSKPEPDCFADVPPVDCYRLRSGDWLSWDPNTGAPCSFKILLEQADGEGAIDSLTATWRSLVKWNNEFFLNWDARSGAFSQQYQLFDPRVMDPESGEVIGEQGAPTYRYVVSAEDVPDQKTGVFRSTEVAVETPFSPIPATQAPDLELDGEDEGVIETTRPAEAIAGQVESFSGEVRSLLYTLSKGPGGQYDRIQYLDPDLISLTGDYSATVVYVSDWDGDGVVDKVGEEGGIPNHLEVVALDVQGNSAQTSLSIVFELPTTTDAPPELEIREIFPALDDDGEALLPFVAAEEEKEEVRLRARAADDRGQPKASGWLCDCVGEEPEINRDRCPCEEVRSGDLNAGGEFPESPWEWIVFEPVSQTRESIGILRATEKVEQREDIHEAKFTAIEINLEPEEEAYKVTVGLPETSGPSVVLNNWENGDIVEEPDKFIVEATIRQQISGLNQVTALYNGEPPENPPDGSLTYDIISGAFFWDLGLGDVTVQEGDRICVGAVSVDGHATLNILEFAYTESPGPEEDWLLLGVTVTSNLRECGWSEDLINLEPEGEAYRITGGLPETRGPAVVLNNLQNGDIVEPDNFIVEATVLQDFSGLNQITALFNGEPRGEPTYDSQTGAFFWDLREFTVLEGDRICVGAVSVDEHATLDILEFADTEEGLLLGVTATPDLGECGGTEDLMENALPENKSAEVPQELPLPAP